MLQQAIRRLAAVAAIIAACGTIATGASAAASANKPIPGKWSCVGQGVFGLFGSGPTYSLNEALQLTTDAKGNVLSGTLIGSSGETCTFPLSGTYKVSAGTLTGKLDLNLTASSNDDDQDFNCNNFFNSVSNPSLELHLVMTGGGRQFFFSGSDDYITNGTSDNGDFVPVSGQCTKQ